MASPSTFTSNRIDATLREIRAWRARFDDDCRPAMRELLETRALLDEVSTALSRARRLSTVEFPALDDVRELADLERRVLASRDAAWRVFRASPNLDQLTASLSEVQFLLLNPTVSHELASLPFGKARDELKRRSE